MKIVFECGSTPRRGNTGNVCYNFKDVEANITKETLEWMDIIDSDLRYPLVTLYDRTGGEHLGEESNYFAFEMDKYEEELGERLITAFDDDFDVTFRHCLVYVGEL